MSEPEDGTRKTPPFREASAPMDRYTAIANAIIEQLGITVHVEDLEDVHIAVIVRDAKATTDNEAYMGTGFRSARGSVNSYPAAMVELTLTLSLALREIYRGKPEMRGELLHHITWGLMS